MRVTSWPTIKINIAKNIQSFSARNAHVDISSVMLEANIFEIQSFLKRQKAKIQ